MIHVITAALAVFSALILSSLVAASAGWQLVIACILCWMVVISYIFEAVRDGRRGVFGKRSFED